MLLGTLGAILLGDILAGKGINRAGEDNLPDKIKDGGICNKSWWVFWYWNLLSWFICTK